MSAKLIAVEGDTVRIELNTAIPALKISIKYQCIRYEKREAFRNSTKAGKLQAS
jgi:hypothetical protein